MKKLRSSWPALAVLSVVVALAFMLVCRESDVLFRLQELGLWLPTKMFFTAALTYPCGCLTWASAFLTQPFYHPTLGVCLMALAWLLICALSVALFRLRRSATLLSALLPMALCAALTQMGYWIYHAKLQGWPWVPTLGLLIALLVQLPLQRSKMKGWCQWAYLICVAAVAYPLMGAWGLLAVLLLGRRSWKLGIVAVLLAAIVPQVCYQWVYTQVQRSELYHAALNNTAFGIVDFCEFRIPYYILLITLALMALCERWGGRVKQWMLIVAGLALCVAGWIVMESRWYRDTNFHKECRMANQIDKLDWEGVLSTMRDQTMGEAMPPTRLMVMEKNLALFRLGRAGNEMFRYPEGSEQYCICGRHLQTMPSTTDASRDTTVHMPADKAVSHMAAPMHISQVGGKMIYYFYGKEHFCYRWCMEDGVEFGWNVNVLKYMAKASLVTGEWEVARKYINMLKRTLYHREWAEHYEQFIEHPELLAQDPEYVSILPMSQFGDRLDGDMTLVELYLLRTFSNGTGADVYYQEMTLICSMIMKDINLFWPRFRQYLNMHQQEEGFRVPTHYQEAAYLYSRLEPTRPSELWPSMTNQQALGAIPFDEEVIKRYDAFMTFNQQCGSMTEEQKKRAFRPQFGDTFYYFYFLERNQKTN